MTAVGSPYTYNATVVRVVDADTVVLDVSLGFGVWLRAGKNQPMSFRLLGCNTRELRAPGGREARDYLVSLLPIGSAVLLRSVEHLVGAGWAARWNGVGSAPVPEWPRTEKPPT